MMTGLRKSVLGSKSMSESQPPSRSVKPKAVDREARLSSLRSAMALLTDGATLIGLSLKKKKKKKKKPLPTHPRCLPDDHVENTRNVIRGGILP